MDDPNSPNIYVYAANNPLTNVEPTGHWNEDSVWWNPFSWFNKSDNNNSSSSSSSSSNNSSSSSNNNNTSNQSQNNQQQSDLDKLTEQAKENQLKLDNIGKQIEELKEQIRKLKANGMSEDEIRQEIVKWALKMVESGALYDNRWEPTLTRADCSGSVYFTFKSAGVNIERDTAQGYYDLGVDENAVINLKDLKPGDVVAWHSDNPNSRNENWTHIQVYLGNVTDPKTGKVVTDAVLNAGGHYADGTPKPLKVTSLSGYTRAVNTPQYGNMYPVYIDLLKALGY